MTLSRQRAYNSRMATWVKLLVPVIVVVGLLAGPLLAVVPLSAVCCDSGSECTVCATAEQPCCVACAGAESSCCQQDDQQTDVERDSGCGSCPLGQCDCCQSLRGVTLACDVTGLELSAASPLAVPALTADSLLISRSDEPLLPPPIG